MPNNNVVTPNFWQKKITDTLDMTNGKKRLHLASRRIDVNKNIFHLVIGLGGSGLTALLETKGLIEQTCENSSSRVAYLALDTSKGDLDNKKSSPETGEVPLNDQEKGLMSDSGLNKLFASQYIGGTLRNYPELFTWADERIDPPGNQTGASGTRQIARLVLTKNYKDLITSIAEKIKTLTTDVVMVKNPQLYVYVVAGIAGGTGSGTFMDIPYLVRDAVHQAGYAQSTQVFGYIFTPDVNFGNGASEDMLKRNGYAALQELDYNLQIPSMGETMNIYYPGKTYTAGGAGDRFFDKIHMVSSKTDHNVSISNPLAHGSRVIAQNILSFVANEQVTVGNAFTVSDYYSNINKIAATLIGGIDDPHRFHEYIAIGSAEFELPIDDIMMYVATLMFERMDKMISAKPDVTDIEQEARVLQIDMGGLFDSLKAQVPFATTMAQPKNFDGLVGDKNYWLNQSMAAFENIRSQAIAVANQAIQAVVKDRTDRFNTRMRDMFLDPEKGPAFVNRVIHFGDIQDGLKDRLFEIRKELLSNWLSRTPDNCPALSGLVQNYRTMTASMERNLPMLGGRAAEKTSRANRINGIGSKIYAISVQLALAELLDKVCQRLYDYIEEKNENLFDMVVAVLECMNSTFKNNGDILTNGDLVVKPGTRTYTWGSLDVPVISYFVRERFDKIIGTKTNDLIENFVKKIWSKADDWVMEPNQFDPVSFVSEFIDAEFNGIAQISVEDILNDLLTVPGTPGNLQSGINNSLMPWLEGQSRPLYSPANRNDTVVYPVWRLISVPANCQNVYNFVQQYCQANYNGLANGYNLQASNLRTRIYMQTVTCALPLSEFKIVEQFEDVYARMRDQATGSEGLHLVHNVNSPHGRLKKTWNDLYTLIPKCSRPDVEYSPAVQKLIAEEDERKKMFKGLIDSNSPMMRLNRPNNAIWSLDVDITTPILRIEGDQLQWVQVIDETMNTENVLKTWSCIGTYPEIKKLQDELIALKTGGFAQLPQSGVKTHIINGTLIINQITGALDASRTWDYLLENCQCRLELVYDVRAEKAKFETLDTFLDKVEKASHDALEKQMDAEMGDFAKLLINGDLMLGTNPSDMSHFFKIRDYDGITRKLGLPVEATFDTIETCFKLYQGYHAIMTSQQPKDVPTQRLLYDRLNAINASMGQDVSKMDMFVKESLLSGIERVKAADKLNQLRFMQNVSVELERFYQKLNSNVEVLKRLLTDSEVFPMPVVKPVKQEAIDWEEI